jgi:hypothetical protein
MLVFKLLFTFFKARCSIVFPKVVILLSAVQLNGMTPLKMLSHGERKKKVSNRRVHQIGI